MDDQHPTDALPAIGQEAFRANDKAKWDFPTTKLFNRAVSAAEKCPSQKT